MARNSTLTPEKTLELLTVARAAVASAADRVSAAKKATERHQGNLLEAVSDRDALVARIASLLDEKTYWKQRAESESKRADKDVAETLAQLLDEVRTIKHQRNVAPEAFVNAVVAKIDGRVEVEAQTLSFLRDENGRLASRLEKCTAERDSARHQCEQLHEFIDQTVMAPV